MAQTLTTPTATPADDAQSAARENRKAGRGGETTVTLTVANMACGGCMRKIETALNDLPGVQMARANLSAKRVMVTMDRAGPDVGTLIDTLAARGFRAAELHEAGDDDARKAERDLMIRMAVAGFASANVMLLSVSVWAGQASGDMSHALETMFHMITAVIALPAVAYAGQPFFRSAATALSARRLNMDVPISLGVLLATGMSLYQTFIGDGHVYFDAAVMLLFFLLIGRFLDTRMRARAAGAAADLLALQAIAADVVGDDGRVRRVAAKDLVCGMTVQVAAGERFPVDGRVLTGSADVDTSLITGESRPTPVSPGDRVFAGAINLNGALTVEAEKVEGETILAEIARLMAVAEQNRGQYVRLADRAAQIYAPAVHLLGLATFIGWMALGFGWEPALTAAIAVLIITCPCALALAVPAVQVAANGRLFDHGVLMKASDGLERLAECDTVVFDKTGTLTTGRMRLATWCTADDATLTDAATLALSSRHPYSQALVAAAEARGLTIAHTDGITEHPGLGLARGYDDGGEARLGSALFCGVAAQTDGAHDTDRAAPHDAHDAMVSTLWFRAADGTVTAFPMVDTLKSDAATTVQRLQDAGYAVEILSGDHEGAVSRVADALGVKTWRAAVSPTEKVDRLKALAGDGRRVVMVGDGLNDAPSLASAHASLSPAEAADVSQVSADALFQGGHLAPVIEALATSRASQNMALQNFAIALAYNLVFVPIAVVGWVTPLIAAIAMSASSIAVTGNAIRLRGIARIKLRAIRPTA